MSTKQTNRLGPFWWPSWISFIGKNGYLNFGESLMKVGSNQEVCVSTKEDGQAENDRTTPTFVGGAIIKF